MKKTSSNDLYGDLFNEDKDVNESISKISMETSAALNAAKNMNELRDSIEKIRNDRMSDLDSDFEETISRYGNKANDGASMSEELLQVSKDDVQKVAGSVEPNENKSGELTDEERAEILKKAMEDLNGMVGLKTVKQQVKEIKAAIVAQQARMKLDLLNRNDSESDDIAAHLVLLGRPGTGKTTVARIYARILKGLGILKKGDLIETDRSGLVAGYAGQTAKLTNKIVDRALDSVLFIDEVYNLNNGDHDTFGQEAISTLMKRMEDDRDRLVVIVAGYTDETERFLDSNPGLRSRFVEKIEFEDYSDEELVEIIEKKAESKGIHLTNENRKDFKQAFKELRSTPAFANGRTARSLLDNAERKQALRFEKAISEDPEMNEDEQRKILTGLSHDDIKQATAATVDISTSKSTDGDDPVNPFSLLSDLNEEEPTGRHSKVKSKNHKTTRGTPGEAKRIAKAMA